MKQQFVTGGVCAVIAAAWLASPPIAAQGRGGAARPGAASVPTPRDAKGHPVLGGIWVATRSRTEAVPANFDRASGNFTAALRGRKNSTVNFERDSGVGQRVFPRDTKPWYRPEYWERVRFNDVHGHNKLAPDPAFQCYPEGVPRIGLPQEIVQTETTLYFLYPLHQRRVYIDGRPHPPVEQWLGTWFGHSVGHWEGDTLVVSTVDFNGQEWMGWPGWFTSPDKEVTERITRVGNTLTYQATVKDDSLLLQPWTMNPQTRQLNTDPLAELEEPLPCLERDLNNMATRERG
jgi:hypothetical protein